MKQFGENVAGYSIPVLNEREIRGGAGILFLFMIISFLLIMLKGDFLLIKYFITVFMLDMTIRVFINPKYSPSLIIARFMVRNQTPQFVGAAQKRFAWIIGLSLSTAMFVHMIIFNAYGPANGISCLICLIFMFFELAFGICIGCKIYGLFNKGKVLHCPGEVCELKDRHEIQKTSGRQVGVLLAFVLMIGLMSYFLNEYFLQTPKDLMEVLKVK
jgi:hypothetical protein